MAPTEGQEARLGYRGHRAGDRRRPDDGGVPSRAGAAAAVGSAPEADAELAVVKSPIVGGTFYRSAELRCAAVCRRPHDAGEKGQVLCIIEG